VGTVRVVTAEERAAEEAGDDGWSERGSEGLWSKVCGVSRSIEMYDESAARKSACGNGRLKEDIFYW
jgi:hypothetical protein